MMIRVITAHACEMAQSNNRVETLDLEENALGAEGTGYIADMMRTNNTITGLVSSRARLLTCQLHAVNPLMHKVANMVT